MKKYTFIIVLFLLVNSFASKAEVDNKGVRVQVKHENQLVFDTIIYESDDQARNMIEALVLKFSKDSIKVNSVHVHGLYVFNIDNDQWKSTESPSHISDDDWAKENYSNTDSLLSELEGELYRDDWNGITIEMAVDSIADAFDVLGKAIREFNYQDSPELVDLKEGFDGLFKKIKSTRVVIITEED